MLFPNGRFIKGRQSDAPADHEKGARDKNFEAEKREAGSQVGHLHHVRTLGRAAREAHRRHVPSSLADWCSGNARGIGENHFVVRGVLANPTSRR
jgi:hypothetical protein